MIQWDKKSNLEINNATKYQICPDGCVEEDEDEKHVERMNDNRNGKNSIQRKVKYEDL